MGKSMNSIMYIKSRPYIKLLMLYPNDVIVAKVISMGYVRINQEKIKQYFYSSYINGIKVLPRYVTIRQKFNGQVDIQNCVTIPTINGYILTVQK